MLSEFCDPPRNTSDNTPAPPLVGQSGNTPSGLQKGPLYPRPPAPPEQPDVTQTEDREVRDMLAAASGRVVRAVQARVTPEDPEPSVAANPAEAVPDRAEAVPDTDCAVAAESPPTPIPTPALAAVAERLGAVCTSGRGEVVKVVDPEQSPKLAEAQQALGGLESGRAYMTPVNPAARHPLTGELKPGDVYRAPFDVRSFSVITDNVPHVSSVTVKGGDLPAMQQAAEKFGHTQTARVLDGQIPGAAVRADAEHEFGVAADMQEEALGTLGRLTYTAIPLEVRTITHLADSTGAEVPVRDYLNSSEYIADIPEHVVDRTGMKPGMGLGDVIIGQNGLQPTQYVYGTAEPNVRVRDVLNGLHFRQYADPSRRLEHPISDYLLEDPLKRLVEGKSEMGNWIPRSPSRIDTAFRTVYGLLGKTYGFDPADVLPKKPITDDTYMRNLRGIPAACAQKGVADIVMPQFVDRITEVAALMHARQLTFSRDEGLGSSMIPRNVTYAGAVLDLDTAGEFTRQPEAHIEQDLAEMLQSIASMRRLVSARPMEGLEDVVWDKYQAHLRTFGVTPAWWKRIGATTMTSLKISEKKLIL